MNSLNIIKSFNEWLSDTFNFHFNESLPSFVFTALSVVITLFAGFWFGNLAGKLLIKILERRNVDRSVHHFLSKSVSVFIKFIFILTALSEIGLNIISFITALGAAAITAGFGLKDSISQFAGGIVILFNQPFKSGDFIEVDGVSGKVEEIHFMNTILIMEDNRQVVIPNNHIISNNVINYTAGNIRRIDLTFSIGYDEDITKAKGVLYRATRDNVHILNEPSPHVAVKEHGSSSVNLICQVWCDSKDYWASYYSMQEDVKRAFDEYGIEIPYEQLDVHIKNTEEQNKEKKGEI